MRSSDAFERQPTNQTFRRWCVDCAADELELRRTSLRTRFPCDICRNQDQLRPALPFLDDDGLLVGYVCPDCKFLVDECPDAATAEARYAASISKRDVAVSRKDRNWLLQTHESARRFSTCAKAAYYASIVDQNGFHISQGWNGVPKGWDHCLEGGCARAVSGSAAGSAYTNCVAQHAEKGAILRAGPKTVGATLYVNGPPCWECAKDLVHAQIARVIYLSDPSYSMAEPEQLWSRSGIEWFEVKLDDLLAGGTVMATTGAAHRPRYLDVARFFRHLELIKGMAA